MKVGVLGSGAVGKVLADGFLKHGHDVMRGSRDPGKLADWKASAGAKARTGSMAETARFGDVVALAVKGTAAVETVAGLGPAVDGKVVIDATNPIADAPPTNGVVRFFTGPNESLLEALQLRAPKARLVKAFSCVGNTLMVNPRLAGGKPTMFICGADADAKRQVTGILDQFGWDAEDCGGAEAARAIEPLCILWCIPGFLKNDWTHAFKLLRP
jgi:predicted dinucleotide-binding enzyme